MDTNKLVYYGGLAENPQASCHIPELGEILTVNTIEIFGDDGHDALYMVTFDETNTDDHKTKFDIECFVAKQFWDLSEWPVTKLLKELKIKRASTFVERHPYCCCFISTDEDKRAGKCEYCGGRL